MSDDLPADWFDTIRKAYPKRSGGQGWGHVRKIIPKLISEGHSFEGMMKGVEEYCALCKANGNFGTPFAMQARTFFGPGEWWLEEYELPTDGSVTMTLDQEAEQYGLTRQDGESDDSLKKRLGMAMTLKQYGMN